MVSIAWHIYTYHWMDSYRPLPNIKMLAPASLSSLKQTSIMNAEKHWFKGLTATGWSKALRQNSMKLSFRFHGMSVSVREEMHLSSICDFRRNISEYSLTNFYKVIYSYSAAIVPFPNEKHRDVHTTSLMRSNSCITIMVCAIVNVFHSIPMFYMGRSKVATFLMNILNALSTKAHNRAHVYSLISLNFRYFSGKKKWDICLICLRNFFFMKSFPRSIYSSIDAFRQT